MFTVPLVEDGRKRNEEKAAPAVQLVQQIEGENETHDEGKRTLVKTALWLQTAHYFLNVVALSLCMLLRPGDYIFVPDTIIWLYVVFGLVSSLSLVSWLARLVYQDQRDGHKGEAVTEERS